MPSKGSFGYIIGRKKRFMHVDDDSNLFWRILVREIYVIVKHYNGDRQLILETFDKIKVAKGSPKEVDVKKCLPFSLSQIEDFQLKRMVDTWPTLLHHCQCSFINLLESGFIPLEETHLKTDDEYQFVLDFNKWEVRFYAKNQVLINCATICEIEDFKDMPQQSYREIVDKMYATFETFQSNVEKVEEELTKLYRLKEDTKRQGAINIEEKVDSLIDDMRWELKELHISRRPFYQRLKDLDLIDCDI
jgi:hypothetical protein